LIGATNEIQEWFLRWLKEDLWMYCWEDLNADEALLGVITVCRQCNLCVGTEELLRRNTLFRKRIEEQGVDWKKFRLHQLVDWNYYRVYEQKIMDLAELMRMEEELLHESARFDWQRINLADCWDWLEWRKEIESAKQVLQALECDVVHQKKMERYYRKLCCRVGKILGKEGIYSLN